MRRLVAAITRSSTFTVWFEPTGSNSCSWGHSQSATATIGGVSVPVLAAVAQGEFAGLDPVNIGPVPRELIGSGEQTVRFLFGGVNTNPVTVNIE